MGSTASVVQALAALGGTGMQAYQLSQQAGQPTGGPKPAAAPAVDQSAIARSMLPSQRANAAVNVGGGISPEFLAGLVAQESGSPEGTLQILDDIRRSLGQQQGP